MLADRMCPDRKRQRGDGADSLDTRVRSWSMASRACGRIVGQLLREMGFRDVRRADDGATALARACARTISGSW